MTGMEHAIEQAARIIVREVGDRIERFPLVEPISMQAARQYARALADAGLLPAPADGRLDRVRVYQDEAGQYRWTRRAPNGEIVAQGEAHTRERDAYRAAARANTPDWTFDREGKG